MASTEDDGDDDEYVYIIEGDEQVPDDDGMDIMKAEKVPGSPEQRLKILVLGLNGAGKTTLVKSFLGEGFVNKDPDTEKATPVKTNSYTDVYSTEMCGVTLDFYDTRGLSDPQISDKKMLQRINSEIPNGFNLVLVCMRMDEEVDQSLVNALREVSNVYGNALWERTIFVLTFANVYAKQLTSGPGNDSTEATAAQMVEHVNDFIDLLHKRLVKDPRWLFSVRESVFRDIPFCMAGITREGNPKDHILPTTQDWVQDLLVACISQSTSETVTALKINQAKKRILVEAGTVGSSAVVGGAAGAFIGGTVGTVVFPGVGTVVGVGIGSLIGGGVGTAAGGGTVVGMRIADKNKPAGCTEDVQQRENVSSTDHLLDRSKQLLSHVKNKFKKS